VRRGSWGERISGRHRYSNRDRRIRFKSIDNFLWIGIPKQQKGPEGQDKEQRQGQRQRGKEAERERGREGKRQRGKEAERERGREGKRQDSTM
jgi:hypothetical protein